MGYVEALPDTIGNLFHLRCLDLSHCSNLNALPISIGNLVHLRCLDLSFCHRLGALPNSITQLQNLQTLDLTGCDRFKALPKDCSKLAKLQHLNIKGCHSLTHMPSRMGKLMCLTTLTDFIVNEGDDSSENQCVGELKDLQFLTELKGDIIIRVKRFIKNSKKKEEVGYLERSQHIKSIHFIFEDTNEPKKDHKAVMEILERHSDWESLSITGYEGTQFPNWGKKVDDWATFLPSLVHIELNNCRELEKLPLLGRLRHLKELTVIQSHSIEYFEISSPATASSKESIFFPSLVSLVLKDLKNLKAWCNDHKWQPSFPCLSTLQIEKCPNFATFICCPSLENLSLLECNQDLRISMGDGDEKDYNQTQGSKMHQVQIDKWDYLRTKQLGCVTSIRVKDAKETTCISQADIEVLQSSFSSLRSVEFSRCPKLTSISEGLERLSSLESLDIDNARILRLGEEDQPWTNLGHNLRRFSLCGLDMPVSVPKGLKYLTSLEDLTIEDWPNLESIPEWISSLSSLKHLYIGNCPKIKSLPQAMSSLTSLDTLIISFCCEELKERCQQDPPQGGDWPKIQHIPYSSISTQFFG